MAIVMHDVNEYVLEFSVPGTQTVADNLQANMVPFPGTIRGILARLGTAGTVSGTQITDIKLNGTSIFANSPKITFAATSKSPTVDANGYSALTASPLSVAKGDILTIQNTAVHGTPGLNLVVHVTIRRSRASSFSAYDRDSVSQTSDAA